MYSRTKWTRQKKKAELKAESEEMKEGGSKDLDFDLPDL
jgi:hypothetical protein